MPAKGALKLIDDEHKTNKLFKERFTTFATLCRESINPDLKLMRLMHNEFAQLSIWQAILLRSKNVFQLLSE